MPPFVRADYAEMMAVESAGRVENSPPHRHPCRGDYRCETVCAGTRMDLPRSASDCRTAGVAVGMGGTQYEQLSHGERAYGALRNERSARANNHSRQIRSRGQPSGGEEINGAASFRLAEFLYALVIESRIRAAEWVFARACVITGGFHESALGFVDTSAVRRRTRRRPIVRQNAARFNSRNSAGARSRYRNEGWRTDSVRERLEGSRHATGDVVLVSMVRWCIEQYYGTDTPLA